MDNANEYKGSNCVCECVISRKDMRNKMERREKKIH
jgi:hypothetical protein